MRFDLSVFFSLDPLFNFFNLGDAENRLKVQIKLGMMQHAREIFADSFRRVTGRKAWDD